MTIISGSGRLSSVEKVSCQTSGRAGHQAASGGDDVSERTVKLGSRKAERKGGRERTVSRGMEIGHSTKGITGKGTSKKGNTKKGIK